jgi:uncharacterized protein YigA (DUF484 family)
MNNPESAAVHPITEEEIANFLVNTPDFFERHAALLAAVQLSSGHGQRAVSLQERQAQLLREKIKALEQRVIEMVRHGQDNSTIADKMQNWMRQLLLVAQPQDMPAVIAAELQKQFLIPQAAIRVWGVDAAHAQQAFAQAFGALVLASSDRDRFQSDMATDFLQRIGELASAALSRLRADLPAARAD